MSHVNEQIEELRVRVDKIIDLLKSPLYPEPLLDVEGVAERLNVSARSVERLIASGELKPIRIGGQRRFDSATVEAYIRRCADRPRRGRLRKAS